jgi:adenine-specific DNA-methyltransferase
MQNILNEIITLFEGTKYINTDGTLNKNLLELETLEHKTAFIPYLLKSQLTRDHFFEKIEEALVFNSQKFLTFLRQKALFKESYTKFRAIALSESYTEKPLKHFGDVVLNFPYKECILEGGQKREEEKREEIYYNTILAPDEITRLKEAKAITNAKRITKEGESPLTSFEKQDNLLIKGNNLLALYSLRKKYAGKVKLIYIDPPYNTGNDGFKYNDSFNHSSWLVFMKNRLEVAKELLAEDGVIFVQIDDNEQAYLKVLMDEVFGRENFVSNMPRKTTSHMRILANYELQKLHDYICVFSKNIKSVSFNKKNVGEMTFEYSDSLGHYTLKSFQNSGADGTRTARPKLYYPIYIHPETKEISLNNFQGAIEILPKKVMNDDGRWLWSKEKVESDKHLLEYKNGTIFRKQYYNSEEDQNKYQAEKTWLDNFANSKGTIALNNILDNKGIFSNPKPEELLEFIIQIATKEGDLVLDFFAGSGTTGAVAHKMNRRWILIEQMDYIETITKVRLQKVLEGEQGGVSKNHKWQGGGSFVYLELAKWNLKFMEEIEEAKSGEELLSLYERLKKQAFFRYDFEPKTLANNLQEFKAGTLEEQKRLLTEVLDANHLYINLGELEDKTYELSANDLKLNKEFYE